MKLASMVISACTPRTQDMETVVKFEALLGYTMGSKVVRAT